MVKQENDFIFWIGHCTYLIKFNGIIIITDPIFSKNAGPVILGVKLGPKRYTEPALDLKDIEKILLQHNMYIDIILLTHNHYDHLDTRTINKKIQKKTNIKVYCPMKLGKYFKGYTGKNINEMNWEEEKIYSKNNKKKLKISFISSIHWSARGLLDRNKTLWGSFIIENMKEEKRIFFACDTGYNLEVYRKLAKQQYNPNLSIINIGAYDFYPMYTKDETLFHTTPSQAIDIGNLMNSEGIIGSHWGTFIL